MLILLRFENYHHYLGFKNMQSMQNNTGYLFQANKLSQREYIRLAEGKQNDPQQGRISPQKAREPCFAKQGLLSFRKS